MPRKCSKCHRESHDIRTCYKYPPEPLPEPQIITDSDEDIDGNDGDEDDDKDSSEPVINFDTDADVYGDKDGDEGKYVSEEKLNIKIRDEFRKKLSNEYGRQRAKSSFRDPNLTTYDNITNKFLEEKFKHCDGRVYIPDMKTIMTRKYLSKLSSRLSSFDIIEICNDFNAILTSFEANDRFIKV